MTGVRYSLYCTASENADAAAASHRLMPTASSLLTMETGKLMLSGAESAGPRRIESYVKLMALLGKFLAGQLRTTHGGTAAIGSRVKQSVERPMTLWLAWTLIVYKRDAVPRIAITANIDMRPLCPPELHA